jgi:DNA-binding CsgD family transcriptional regulator
MPQNDVRPSGSELTQLQVKCLDGFWNRKSAKQIGAELGISEAWVNKNLMAARRHFNVNSSAEAAAILFGAKPSDIKNYYYQETGLPEQRFRSDAPGAGGGKSLILPATSERTLINSLGVGRTLGAVLIVAIAVIAGLLLMLQTAEGIAELWRTFGY